ncbi:MAG: hypothetical protein ACO2PN_15600 [Pyrobaculum sp.]|jgi:hypothetical protein
MSNIWELEKEVRHKLQRGISFGNRALAVAGLEDAAKWVKLEDNLLEVIYIKGFARLTIHAAVGGGKLEIMSATLDSMTP